MEEIAKSEKQALLSLARQSIAKHLSTPVGADPWVRPEAEMLIDSVRATGRSPLQEKVGVFVSLHYEGELRGCIGCLEARASLGETLPEMAIAAATKDPRFAPVTLEELSKLHLEISLLSPFEEIRSLEAIEVGRHGLHLSEGMQRGLLLPQVAVQWGWDRETFLSHTCLKAGLSPERWREWPDERLKIQIFTAYVFGEGEETKEE